MQLTQSNGGVQNLELKYDNVLYVTYLFHQSRPLVDRSNYDIVQTQSPWSIGTLLELSI